MAKSGYYERWTELLTRNVERTFDSLASFLPALLGSLTLLLVGWLLAKLLRSLILRLGTGLDRLTQSLGLEHRLQWLRTRWSVSRLLSSIVYWLTLLFFVIAAAENMGLPGIAHWLTQGISYLPHVFAAAVIIMLGYALTGFLNDVLNAGESGERSGSAIIARMVTILVMTVAVLAAAEQLGVDVGLLSSLVTISVAAAVGGLAFAFGMGAGGTVDNLIATRYVRDAYRVGDRIRIGDVEGVIIEISRTAVTIDSVQGRVHVPARKFSSESSILLDRTAATDG